MDTFAIEAVDLQDIQKLVVGHNGSGDGKGWKLEKAILKVPIMEEERKQPDEGNSNNNNNKKKEVKYKEYEFPCDRYFKYIYLVYIIIMIIIIFYFKHSAHSCFTYIQW